MPPPTFNAAGGAPAPKTHSHLRQNAELDRNIGIITMASFLKAKVEIDELKKVK